MSSPPFFIRISLYFSIEAGVLRKFTAVIEKDTQTGLYAGYVPGFPGAHTQAESLDELRDKLREVIEMLLEAGEPEYETEFIGIQEIVVV